MCGTEHSRVRGVPWALLLALVWIGTLATGCVVARYGPSVDDFAPAQSPHGVEATLLTPWGEVEGELLQVTDHGLLILEPDGIFEVPWSVIAEASFTDVRMRWNSGAAPSPADRQRLTLVSRYVAGLTDEQRSSLLRHHGLDAPLRYPRPDGGGPRSQSQEEPRSIERASAAGLLEATRSAVERYRVQEDAILAGYRPLGPDFPGMGAHWVNPYFVIRSGLDPLRPAVITYLDTPGGTILTGAAFLQVLLPGEEPPSEPFHGAWHDHSGTVDEETLALNPAAAHHAGHDEPRIAMLHVWTGLDNPDGPFAQENWAIPFVRLGLPVPREVGPAAGKALFLASGGDTYYLGLIRILGDLAPEQDEGVARLLIRWRARVEELLSGLDPAGPVGVTQTSALVPALENVWHALWRDIRKELGPDSWQRVRLLGS
jgi:hypothetical protein